MSIPRSKTASAVGAAVPTSRDDQIKMLFARLARPVASSSSSAASTSSSQLRLPLSSLPDALRCLGLRLMTEDVDDIVAAAAPFAPLSLSHFGHFVGQAQQQGRHNEDREVSAAFNELAAAAHKTSDAVGKSPRAASGAAPANDIALSDLHRLLTTQGDALTPDEWQRYLRTMNSDTSGATPAASSLSPSSMDRRRVRVGEVM